MLTQVVKISCILTQSSSSLHNSNAIYSVNITVMGSFLQKTLILLIIF